MYSVEFPDIEGAFTSGENMADALMMAEDVLALMLYDLEADKKPIPAASVEADIALKPGEIVNYVACDTFKYQKMYNTKSVKRTLSLPAWLNEAALERGVNFSQVLQDGLRKIVLN